MPGRYHSYRHNECRQDNEPQAQTVNADVIVCVDRFYPRDVLLKEKTARRCDIRFQKQSERYDKIHRREFAAFSDSGTTLEIENDSEQTLNLMIFGGEKYTEPVVPYGPFVMNTEEEIRMSYRDFHAGKYGTIKYD